VETSGSQYLDVSGAAVNTMAPAGTPGRGCWTRTISKSRANTGSNVNLTLGPNFTTSNDTAILDVGNLVNALGSNDVVSDDGLGGKE